MLRITFRVMSIAAFLFFLSSPVYAKPAVLAIDPATCLGCHSDKISPEAFSASVHGRDACNGCHTNITDIEKHTEKKIKPEKVNCQRCHKKENAEHYASVHIRRDIACADCHTDVHTHRYWKGDKRIAVAKCIQCHDKGGEYQKSVHGKAVAARNPDTAACHDCHNLHDIKSVSEANPVVQKEFHTKVCSRCHADEKMMARAGILAIPVKTYLDSYHGKNYRLGYPEKVAGCTDCHTAHAIFRHDNPDSSINPQNLVKTCAQCHPKASKLFTQFYSHGDYSDKKNYPLLYWTFIAMTGLLISVFAVFWFHSLLWMFRGFVENREKTRALSAGKAHVVPEGYKQYRRFGTRDIFLHLLVMVSFLGLALTGAPLKFSDQEWARLLISFLGGTDMAGLIHRICAVIMFIGFGWVIFLTIHFLFLRRDIPGNWLDRLMGPDSLCPSPRDVQDVGAMVRWFFFKGPKPVFERWTYWEKFDFMAVFWGMFAIGGSGLMLWFPEFFGLFLPGWTFNIATVIHSDEALLATGFIFTVHFFNTHLRPEKFPMDFVIFNGQISKHELIEERRDQWERYEKEGITEQFHVTRLSGVLYDFLFKGFGFLAVFIGIGLLILMIYAFLLGVR
ncbi:MAG: cytochrome c3 family protein [Smithellaceae bacterium]|nr:cytochrome c3 family protein [Smithellaceae bacterium]